MGEAIMYGEGEGGRQYLLGVMMRVCSISICRNLTPPECFVEEAEVSVCVIDMCPHLYRERESVHPSSLPSSPAPVLLSLAVPEAPVLPHSWGFRSTPALNVCGCLGLTRLPSQSPGLNNNKKKEDFSGNFADSMSVSGDEMRK